MVIPSTLVNHATTVNLLLKTMAEGITGDPTPEQAVQVVTFLSEAQINIGKVVGALRPILAKAAGEWAEGLPDLEESSQVELNTEPLVTPAEDEPELEPTPIIEPEDGEGGEGEVDEPTNQVLLIECSEDGCEWSKEHIIGPDASYAEEMVCPACEGTARVTMILPTDEPPADQEADS